MAHSTNIIRRQCTVLSLTALFLIVLIANVYFIYVIVGEKPVSVTTIVEHRPVKLNNDVISTTLKKTEKPTTKQQRKMIHRNSSMSASRKIEKKLISLPLSYKKVTTEYKKLLAKLIEDLNTSSSSISTDLWNVADQWVTAREIIPESAPQLGSILRTLCSTKIIKAENARGGTQLKLMLTLVGNKKAIFKPQWYPRTGIIDGPVYAGKDRHNAEVAAFHLGVLLGLRRIPLTVGRKVNLRREIMPVATNNLLDTFYQEGNNTCFYGVCYYCSPQDAVCAKQDTMEGAVIMWLPPNFKLKKYRSPWQRTYKSDALARWEVDVHYCDRVKVSMLYNLQWSVRLLDLIDAAVFDFLIDNGDRHHYEVFENVRNSMMLLLDNGKSFGNPYQDHLDILAPLYQCCIIRQSTWERLSLFSGNVLGKSLEVLLSHSHIAPVLTAEHLKALDRRLALTFAAIEVCFEENGKQNVLFQDMRKHKVKHYGT